jgi:DNA-binding HxlR family transcriptional regulator
MGVRGHYHNSSDEVAMRHTPFRTMPCPIARGLDRVGEWWSILILRDALGGVTRFDDFQKNLGIAPGMLARRLKALVDEGLMERRRYSERPPRDEYVLTRMGEDFRPVLIALLTWGNRHFTPDGVRVQIVEAATGRAAEPVMVDRVSGQPIATPAFQVVAGPAASAVTRARLKSGSGLLPPAAPGDAP